MQFELMSLLSKDEYLSGLGSMIELSSSHTRKQDQKEHLVTEEKERRRKTSNGIQLCGKW